MTQSRSSWWRHYDATATWSFLFNYAIMTSLMIFLVTSWWRNKGRPVFFSLFSFQKKLIVRFFLIFLFFLLLLLDEWPVCKVVPRCWEVVAGTGQGVGVIYLRRTEVGHSEQMTWSSFKKNNSAVPAGHRCSNLVHKSWLEKADYTQTLNVSFFVSMVR